MSKSCKVQIERSAEKQLRRVPKYILEGLLIWSQTIEQQGVQAMRKLPGYHDEPLKGDRVGQRSSRLTRDYRVIYEERNGGEIVVIAVLEVNKHDY